MTTTTTVTPKQVKDVANKWFATKRPTLAVMGSMPEEWPGENWVDTTESVLQAAAEIGWTPPPEPEPVYPFRLTESERRHLVSLMRGTPGDGFGDLFDRLLANATPEKR